MKKGLKKFTKILILIAMIFSELMTPISVLAETINVPNKGDMGINGEVTNNGNSATVSVGSVENEGGVKVTKTVSKTDTEGRYKIDFEIKGKDVHTSTEINKPVYAVVVFDRSSSMNCTKYDRNNKCIEVGNKWEKAVQGAKDFANTLLKKIPTAQIALVTFSGDNGYLGFGDITYNDATVLRSFSNTNLDSTDFGSANGGTNLQAGLYEANKLLNASSIPSDAYKYVVVISDGKPTFYYDDKGYTQGTGNSTNENTYNATINMANTVKNTTKAEVFSIGYMLPSGKVYGNKTAADILTEVSSPDKAGSTVKHYVDGKPEDVANAFTNIAEEIGTAYAGTNATLIDTIGDAFTVVANNNISVNGNKVTFNIDNITENGSTISFYVDVNQDAQTGWYNTNEGFNLEYTDANGNKQPLNCNENPQVYWVQNTYDYVVNYYKDSFDTNPIASEPRKDVNGTIINESNVDRDKYLPTGYEFNTINPSSITITNDGIVKEINILYTIKKFNYVVNYFYENSNGSYSTTPNNTQTITANYGTNVNASDFYNSGNGYVLDSSKSDNGNYNITNNNTVINIYYKREDLTYNVKYYFEDLNGNYVENTSLTQTNQPAKYGDVVTADSKQLTTVPNGFSYNSVKTNSIENQNGSYTINLDNVEVKLYYERNSYAFSVNYYFNGNFKSNVPTVNGSALYDSEIKGNNYKLTTEQLTEKGLGNFRFEKFNPENIRINLEDNIINLYYVSDGNVKVVYLEKNNETNVLATEENITEQVGANYNVGDTTEYNKTIYGYTLAEIVGNTTGTHAEEEIVVKYLYTKNIGDVTKNEVTKTQNNEITDINSIYKYTLGYNGKIENYVGEVTLTLTDNFDNKEVTIISKDNRCTYSNSTLTCAYTQNINEQNQEINVSFNVEVKYNNPTKNITNTVDSTLTYGNENKTDTASVTDTIPSGTVVATYEDTEGNALHEEVTSTNLAGISYTTEAKTFYGYTLKETPSNKEGEYVANSTKYVNYVYIKNNGTSEDELVKEGLKVSSDINEPFTYTITYNTEIKDYLGEATLVITDILPYEIDLNKSKFSNNCKYEDGKIVCTYKKSNIDFEEIDTNITNRNIKFNIKEELTLYYINVDNANVTNEVESVLTYGRTIATNNDKTTTEVKQSTVTINYITNDGTKLADSITIEGLVGSSYTTEKREFDKYSFIEVRGNANGKFTEENTEVTYVYDLTPLPPQTGVESNIFMFINYIIAMFAILMITRAYKEIKNN